MTRVFTTLPLHETTMRDLRALGELSVASAPTAAAITAESVGAEIIVVRAPIPDEAIIDRADLRACVRHGAGLDMIPMDVATEAGVLVANVPGANAVSVAEHAIWTAMALLRQHPRVRRDLYGTGWDAARAHADAGREMSGRTIGIIGFGNVGRNIARMASQGFGMRVLAHTRSTGNLPEGVEAATLEALLAGSDIVALCCPLTDATRGMIDGAALAAMRPGALLINVGRGPLVDEAALIKALQSGHLGGAALDVFATQPLARDHPFMTLDNVVLTPHMAGMTAESMQAMGQGVVQAVRQILAGELPDTLCNPEAVTAYRTRFPKG